MHEPEFDDDYGDFHTSPSEEDPDDLGNPGIDDDLEDDDDEDDDEGDFDDKDEDE